MKDLTLWGTGIKSISPAITSQRRLNCYFETVEAGEKKNVAIRQTPGLTLGQTLPQAPVRGYCKAGNYEYVVAGSGVYQFGPTLGYVLIGTIPYGTNPVGIDKNETQVMIVDGTGGYVFNYALIDTSVQTVANIAEVNSWNTKCTLLNTLCAATGNS